MLCRDDVGMCKSKSRKVLVDIRDALEAREGSILVGQTVERISTSPRGGERGVIVGVDPRGGQLLVRLLDSTLGHWDTEHVKIVEPVSIDHPTTWDAYEP